MAKQTKQAQTKPARPAVARKPRLVPMLASPLVAKVFVVAALVILLATIMLWTVTAASLHQANADQLIDTYMFEDAATFSQALFPGAHSFVLKWPLFALMAVFGSTPYVFLVATVLMVVATIGGLVYVLYRIDKRPFVFGVYCLALASILLLIPAQPYAGALLPVNMAMTTTRNLEYLVLLLVFWFAASLPKLKSWQTIVVGLVLTVLIASDKLFAVLAVGSCLFAAVWYTVILRRKSESLRALGWLLMVISAFGAGTVLLILVNSLGITGVAGGETASPFALVTTVQQLALGLIFGVGAVLTNFGANPLHAVTILRDIPAAARSILGQPWLAGYIVNLLLLLAGLYAVVRVLLRHRRAGAELSGRSLQWLRMSVLLVGATLAAGAVFVLTDHYYPVDSRYLAISLFAVAVASATYWSTRPVRLRLLGIAALLLVVTLPLSAARALQEYNASSTALQPRNQVTARVSNELERRDVDRLVGDYWDVTPVKGAIAKPLVVAPVDNCRTPRPVLNSRAWFKPAAGMSTAYLAVRDGSAEAGPNASLNHQANTATYGGCSLEKVIGTYGVPSERVRVDNSINDNGLPDVLLLLYPNGTKSADQAEAERRAVEKPKTPIRKTLTALPDQADCNAGVSLQIVAHQDDDILFMNPDVLMSIKAGRCQRTVYLTAGNAGENVNYWGGREQGAKAAYAEMYGVANVWRDEQQYVGDYRLTVSYLQGTPKVSLVFMRLPDGNLRGQGFPGDDYTSLQSLLQGTLPSIQAVDDSATYTKDQLVATLAGILNVDQPDEIRTLGSDDHGDGDHADHHAAGQLTTLAAAAYGNPHAISQYLGYPEREMPANLTAEVIGIKQSIFLAYAKHDGAVCQTVFECDQTPTYGSYLMRQYGQTNNLSPEQAQPTATASP